MHRSPFDYKIVALRDLLGAFQFRKAASLMHPRTRLDITPSPGRSLLKLGSAQGLGADVTS